MKHVALSLLCVAICSCNSSTSRHKGAYSVPASRDNTVCSFGGSCNVSRLFPYDEEKLIVLTEQEPFFSVINIDDGSLVNSFGRKGRARNEFLSVPQWVNYRDGELQFFDFAARSLARVKVPDGTVDLTPVPYSAPFRPLSAVQVNGQLIAVGGLQEGRVACADTAGNISFGPEYPYPTKPLSGVNRGVRIQSEIIASPDGSNLVIRTLASDCFEIYSVDASGLKRIFVNDFKYPPVLKGNRLNPEKSRGGYIRASVDDEHIYLTYTEDSYLQSSNSGLVSDMVHIFDWTGRQTGILHLPEKVGAFCVKDSLLFGAIADIYHSEIVRFSIQREHDDWSHDKKCNLL